MDLAREEEIRLVKDEFNRLISSYNHNSFVLNCKVRSRLPIQDHRDGARFVADEALINGASLGVLVTVPAEAGKRCKLCRAR